MGHYLSTWSPAVQLWYPHVLCDRLHLSPHTLSHVYFIGLCTGTKLPIGIVGEYNRGYCFSPLSPWFSTPSSAPGRTKKVILRAQLLTPSQAVWETKAFSRAGLSTPSLAKIAPNARTPKISRVCPARVPERTPTKASSLGMATETETGHKTRAATKSPAGYSGGIWCTL